MTTRTRTQITIQTRQTIIVRPLAEAFRAWCDQCLEVVTALTQDSVSELLGIPTETLRVLLAGGRFHPVEREQSGLICANSLPATATQNITIEGERK